MIAAHHLHFILVEEEPWVSPEYNPPFSKAIAPAELTHLTASFKWTPLEESTRELLIQQRFLAHREQLRQQTVRLPSDCGEGSSSGSRVRRAADGCTAGEERDRARNVVEELRRRYAGRLDLRAILWEELPLQANLSFQQGIDLVCFCGGVHARSFPILSLPLICDDIHEAHRAGFVPKRGFR